MRPQKRRRAVEILSTADLPLAISRGDLPLVTRLGNSSRLCAAAEASPGPLQLVRAPGCLAVKLVLMAIGVVGLWATRSLYGREQVHTAQFSRLR